MKILIRKEEEKDYQKIYEVNELAFQQENESKLIEKIRKNCSKLKKQIPNLFLLLLCSLFLSGCLSPTSPDLPSEAVLTALPCDSSAVRWMQPFGNVDHGGGNAFFHNGIDFGTMANGRFFSCADGIVTQIEMNTGAGWPGTNYRITIQVATDVYLDYHFEIAGSVPELQRKSNIFVNVGDAVSAGQHIGNLIVLDPDISHVHWSVFEGGTASKCPLDYFTANVAQKFEALYDSGIEKRPSSRADLCE